MLDYSIAVVVHVLCLYEMATCTVPSAVEEVKKESVGPETKSGV